MITIFTPTYNRAHLLHNLYNSLCIQTEKNFEWLIIDDGSSDNTQEVVQNFIDENRITIRYQKQENQGKHIAINNGVALARCELFFIVDSDDVLPNDSLEKIIEKYQLIKNNKDIVGIAGRRGYITGGYIGTNKKYSDIITTSLNFRFNHRIEGDMAEVFRTEILRKFPFPFLEGEKFCPEALIWQKIDQFYKMLWFSDIIYRGEYIEGGLSANIFKVRKNSPKASCLYYSELSKYNISYFQKIKAVANYWRFSIYDDIPFREKLKKVSIVKTIISLPLITLLLSKDGLRL